MVYPPSYSKSKDWAKVGAVAFVLTIVLLYFANKFEWIAGLDDSVKMIIFFVLIGVALYVTFRLLGETKVGVSWGNMVIYIAILVGIVYVIIQFNIFPEFSIVANNLKSIVGA